MQKIKVYHFHNGGGGGVFSVIKNLLRFSIDTGMENHIIYTINKKAIAHFEIPKIDGAISQQVFYYSPKWNFYYTCKKLSKLLADDKAVVAAHDWLELGMASNLGLQNPVVHFVHGNYDYYYDLAKKHEQTTDQFITVSPVIHKKLSLMIPQRNNDIHYCRFPVPSIKAAKKENENLKILYCVRSLDDENKQFKILPAINAKLISKGVKINWTIIGDGISKEEVENLMDQHTGIGLYASLPNDEVIKLMQEHDLLILPSLKEGFPVVVVEAMKAGMVPLVTNWEGATGELIVNGVTGFYFKAGDIDGYAKTVSLLDRDRNLLKKSAAKGISQANKLFDPWVNTEKIQDIIITTVRGTRLKKAFKSYGSRLDDPRVPNFMTRSIRNW